MKSGENCSSPFREEDVKDYTILYMYISKGQGQITSVGQNFNSNCKVLLL